MGTEEPHRVAPGDILILDYGVGNIRSVANALAFLGYPHTISSAPESLRSARMIIFPGVGSFGEAMRNLNRLDLRGPLEEEVVGRRKPILGICLGMQLFAESSEEEGSHAGLSWIPGRVERLEVPSPMSVPHVGWNEIDIRSEKPLFSRTGTSPHFYFDHGYHFRCPDKHILATCSYGGEVTAAISRGNIYGVQFHPEKSHNNGLRLFRGFILHVLGSGETSHA